MALTTIIEYQLDMNKPLPGSKYLKKPANGQNGPGQEEAAKKPPVSFGGKMRKK